MDNKIKGGLYGATAAACYGTNPLFALPMGKMGIDTNSILFYRYVFAALILFVVLKFIKKYSLKINKKECFWLFILGLLFSFSSLTLFEAFNYIEAGIACTILFIYPVMVAFIMTFFFREKIKKELFFAIIMTVTGICLLYNGTTTGLNIKGVIIVLVSALSYALYIVGIKTIKTVQNIKGGVLTFYVILFGLFIYIVNLKFCTELKIINTPFLWMNAIGLSIVPTIISLEFLTRSINLIGSTPTAVLGALEPLTALFFGVLLFNEALTFKIITGVILILIAVFTVILSKDK